MKNGLRDLSRCRNQQPKITTEKFMTVDQQIRLEASENTTFEHIKGLLEKGMKADFIADAFKIPLQRVEEIIRKIKGN